MRQRIVKLSPALARYVGDAARLRITLAVAATLLHAGVSSSQSRSCPSLQIEGEVQQGKSYTHRIDAAHVFLLESIASGWIVRVLPAGPVRPPHDYAELATPPYRSPNPLLISTDFAFRAQDAIAWNPRAFHFFTTPAQLAAATSAWEATMREPNRPSAGAALFPLLSQSCAAELRILDARIAGGTGDQSAMAAAVAFHFAETAHTLETNATPGKLGRIVSMRFRVVFQATGNPSSR